MTLVEKEIFKHFIDDILKMLLCNQFCPNHFYPLTHVKTGATSFFPHSL